ncbi:hypothetical protein BDZ90DRAFT_244852 [Jaminaea rosea]|uniref:Structural maintenance of chromosomes protein 4 n=1 Tax=Jaminaea rosea TaxID=1569628 RepID=A0A316V0F9_9BASI|nr:hypothetical protein BDZ90DRAFT_244852 [Jaminaea rosea]PWN30041.1 hypothetical protein BDZ90DRAFT_244852 [Jaminaea rosea]
MPPRKASASASKPTSSSSSSSRVASASSRAPPRRTATRKQVVESDSDEEDEDGEDEMALGSPDESEEEEEEEAEQVKPARRGVAKKAPAPSKTKVSPSMSRRAAKSLPRDESPIDKIAKPSSSSSRGSRKVSARATPPVDENINANVADDDSQTPAEADKSDSIDADATFVAPTRGTSPEDSVQGTPARPRASQSIMADTPGTSNGIPSTPLAPKQPTKRLVIHKLVLRDFKSYAGNQTIGPFHKSFSSVVGPNGSGKSNVIDALLFVFGWRANKMRQGKLGELIHTPSMADVPRPSETQVSVVFREIEDLPGPDAYRVVPKSKLVVSRTAFLNNTSVYHMNGKRSTFTEVTTLLRDKGIDLDHKRFLILQGEVESIAQMPPKARNEHEEGLLEYLEDIIGTSRFKEEIETAAKTVDECNEQRGERLSRLKIVQREKDAMEGKKREAESLLRDQNSLTRHQSMLWQVYMWEARSATTEAQDSIATLTERIAKEREKHQDAQANVAELEASYSAVQKEWESMKKEMDKLTKEVERLEKEDLQIGEKRKHFETKKKKLTKAMSDDKHHLSEARTTLTSSEDEIGTLRMELAKLEASLEKEEASLDSIRDSLKGKTGHLTEAMEAKQRDLAPWMDKVKAAESQRDVKAQEVDLIKGREEARERDVEDARRKRTEIKDELRGKHEELQSLAEEKDSVVDKINESEERLNELKTREAKMKGKVAAARSKADDAKSTQQASASQSSVLTSLARQAELGMIKGFHGRLGSLGVIDDKYDVAISTACPGLDSIVVETVDCGQACIEHLRKNNLGRANFILLDSVSNLRVEPVETPDNPREARFLPAFYHQLRDTLVARDLAHANRIAYGAKRWRLIDKSGTMSGGGTRFADAEYSPEQIARMQQEVIQLDGELQTLSLKVQRVETELRQIEVEMEKAQMALKVGKTRYEECQARVEELKAQNKPDAADATRLEELQGEISALEAEIKKLRSKTTSFETEISALQEKILDAGGIREMMNLSTEKATKAEVAKSKADKDIVKYSTAMEKRQAEIDDLEEEMSGLKDSASDKGSVTSKARAKLDEKAHAFEVKQEKRDELKEALDESSSTINAFRALELEIKQKLDDNQRALAENGKRLKHWEEKHAGLELHYVGEDEDDSEAQDDDEEQEGEQEEAEAGAEGGENEAKKQPKASTRSAPDLNLPIYEDEELESMSKDDLKSSIATYEERVQKGSGNFAILDEYRKREQEFLSRAKDLEQTTQQRDAAKNRHDELRRQRLDEFMTGFGIISSKLKEMYQTITLGGNAELELVDSLDPFSEGILFSVMPPKKSWKNISNLSGGEKTLSSLALVFALHAFKPTPLYVMDEIDAALDFRNVSIVANLIKERTKNAQFVIISLRNNMFELASRLVGIYKTNGQTKSLAVENTELSQAVAEEAAAAAAAVAASARKARNFPGPPRTPMSSVQHAQRMQMQHQASLARRRGCPSRSCRGRPGCPPTTPRRVCRRTRRRNLRPES